GASLDGEDINIGQDLVDELSDNDDFKWTFKDSAEAEEDLVRGEAYGVVKISENASEQASGLLESGAENMDIEIRTNPGYNFLGSVMGANAGSAIKDEVSLSITELYTETLVESLSDVKTSNEELLDALIEMQSGTEELIAGTEQLESGLEDLDVGINES